MATEGGRETRSRSDSRKELDSYFQSEVFMSLVNKTISKQFEQFVASSEFKNMLVQLHTTLDKEIQEKVEPLKKQIKDLSDELGKVKIHANDNEQYSRRCNVRIHGIPEKKDENCYEVVTEFCKQDLGCEFGVHEIDRTHRVGKPKDDSPRVLIVKFCSYQSKAKVMKSRRNLKGSSMYVNEDLTAFNKDLFPTDESFSLDKRRKSSGETTYWPYCTS